MQNAENVETVERATLLNKVAYISVALNTQKIKTCVMVLGCYT